MACWEYPNTYQSYLAVGIGRFREHAEQLLEDALIRAFGSERPSNVRARLVEGYARMILIEASKEADLLVLGPRGHGAFAGLLLGSVTSACIAHAYCPVLVAHGRAATTGP
ncbi:universal stress protein [Arthrobacter sp. D1-29]